eukprot:NODE_26698_length_541_cov_4.896135.p4 GENE.NODE_26698_length_541_cov_4.896135~~NODE_26698_length_541_cov_4.896135.p4  ORF type:complete len:61 (+),score=17.65 NODE_26698_length_541_cov_4.896135:192-374(+)
MPMAAGMFRAASPALPRVFMRPVANALRVARGLAHLSLARAGLREVFEDCFASEGDVEIA